MEKKAQIVTGDGILASNIRHGITFLAGILVGAGYLDAEAQGTFVETTVNLLTQAETLTGLLLYGTGIFSSRANKAN